VETAQTLLAVDGILCWDGATLERAGIRTSDPKRVDVPPDLAARAMGCAQCAPVAVTGTSARSTSTSAGDPTRARHR